jgi:hypothetical protein
MQPRRLADLDRQQSFLSTDEPGPWISWDFLDLRLCPSYYIICSFCLKSWVLEASLNAETWRVIDRKTNTQDFTGDQQVSFTIATPMECRFIRLTQTDKNHDDEDQLMLAAVEFFGALSK